MRIASSLTTIDGDIILKLKQVNEKVEGGEHGKQIFAISKTIAHW